ncbi:MAG: DNA-methyltransferase [Candidatus Dormibacteria bacterium]
MILGETAAVLASKPLEQFKGQVQMVFTSPPFPLNRKKAYGNLSGDAYIEWLADFAPKLRDYLTPDGSIVLELGNSWEQGQPTMSTLGLRALLAFLAKADLHLCQQFVCHNPARLPSPVQWVNIDRSRVKDAFTHVWWMSPVTRPKADNRAVVTPYTDRMLKLLHRGEYNAGKRPSEHGIGSASFLKDNGGAIPPNVLTFSNTQSNDSYQRYCRAKGLKPHPARMQPGLAEFFVRLLTDQDDLVMDPFAGSNTTGAVAENLGRQWVGIEGNADYVEASRGRFPARPASHDQAHG